MELIVDNSHVASVICVNGLGTPFTLFIKAQKALTVELALGFLLDLTAHLLSTRGAQGIEAPFSCQLMTSAGEGQGTWYEQV